MYLWSWVKLQWVRLLNFHLKYSRLYIICNCFVTHLRKLMTILNILRTESTNEGSLQFRLLLICGRTEDGLKNAIKKVHSRNVILKICILKWNTSKYYLCKTSIQQIENLPYNPEFVSLTNDVFVSEMPFHIYRGYTVLPKYTDSYFEVKVST